MIFFQKLKSIFSKPSRARGVNFFFPFRHPEDDINQFVACSEKFARSMQIFPGLIGCSMFINYGTHLKLQ